MELSSRKDDRPIRRYWEFLLLLLALLMGFACVFLSTWLALRGQSEMAVLANMLPVSTADYGRLSGEGTLLAVLDPSLIGEAATDVARLARTPVSASSTPLSIVRLPPTPTATPTASPTATPTATPVATPASVSTPTPAASPTPTSISLPTSTGTPSAPPTATGTRAPTDTPASTATPIVPATATSTFVPTNTPISVPTDTPTSMPTDTPTSAPTDTPTPTNTPTSTSVPTPPPPIVLAVLPNTQVNTNAISVTITGLNFQSGCSAALGSVPLIVSSCTPTTTVLASVPLDIIAGYYDLTVTNPDSQSGTLPGAYTATNPIPLVTGITPALSVIASSNLAVTINGDNFRNTGAPGGLSASLDGIPLVAVNYVSPTMLTAEVPFASPGVMDLGVYTLTVTNPGPTAPTGSLANAFTVYTYTTTCEPMPGCINATEPDGTWVDLMNPTQPITIDFGLGSGIMDGSGYDMVFYERAALPGILLDWIIIELSADGTNWYTVFEWNGENPGDVAGTNIDGYAADANGELDNEPIQSSDLYPSPPPIPYNTGVAIDIGVAAQAVQPPQGPLPPGPFRWVRIWIPPGGADGAEIDAVVRLH